MKRPEYLKKEISIFLSLEIFLERFLKSPQRSHQFSGESPPAMAPHDDRSDGAEEAMVAEAEKRPIATIVIIIGSHPRSLVFLLMRK